MLCPYASRMMFFHQLQLWLQLLRMSLFLFLEGGPLLTLFDWENKVRTTVAELLRLQAVRKLCSYACMQVLTAREGM